jgi:tRNA A37 threonylcarbamoyladenosine dehydratase
VRKLIFDRIINDLFVSSKAYGTETEQGFFYLSSLSCSLNSNVEIEVFEEAFTTSNAVKIIQQFDVILDCTDNAATRYLLNDACVISKKPLISGR